MKFPVKRVPSVVTGLVAGVLLISSTAIPAHATNRMIEVSETCHVRKFAPISDKLGSWKVTLCVNFTYKTDEDGAVTVEPNGEARIQWSSLGLGRVSFSAGDSDAWIVPIEFNDDGNAVAYKVMGYQNVIGKAFPTGQINIDVAEKAIYDGFIIGPGLYTDFMYSSKIDYWKGENEDSPLDTDSPCDGYEMSCGGQIHWAGGYQV